MPRPVDRSGVYLPALDGLRAIAVGVVVAYHLGIPSASGGLLGVGVFFTLSGFLITSILRSTWQRTGRTCGTSGSAARGGCCRPSSWCCSW